MGELRLCRSNPERAGGAPDGAEQKVACLKDGDLIAKAVRVPQFGQLRFVPLKNDIFENSGLVINIDETGQPSDISFISSKAAGATLAAATSKIASEAKTFDEARRAKAEAKAAADAIGVDPVKRAA